MAPTDTFVAFISLVDFEAFRWAESTIVSLFFSAIAALLVFWLKSRERLKGTIAWTWRKDPWGQHFEKPFLVVRNKSNMPAFLIGSRLLKGNFIKREARHCAFDYEGVTDGNFPLEIAAQGVSSIPLSVARADYFAARARWFNKVSDYIFKRPYLWIDLTTISGMTNFRLTWKRADKCAKRTQ